MFRKIFFIFFVLLNIIYGGDSLKVKNKKHTDPFIFTNGKTKIIIDENGGRITSFTLDGYEFLIQKEEHELNFGSTLWPSPQSIWNWPPLKTLDSDPYLIDCERSHPCLVSGIDSATGLVFAKSINKSDGENSFVLNFKISNEAEKEIGVAPWQISRVKKGGLLFFPIGQGGQKQKFFPMAETQQLNGIIWYKSNHGEKLESHKINIADGSEGWLAYAIDGRLFVKKYEDHEPSQFAPGEAEVIFYTSGDKNYIEIELQGAYEKLSYKSEFKWNVEWMAFEVPSGINVEVGNEDLINFVREKVK